MIITVCTCDFVCSLYLNVFNTSKSGNYYQYYILKYLSHQFNKILFQLKVQKTSFQVVPSFRKAIKAKKKQLNGLNIVSTPTQHLLVHMGLGSYEQAFPQCWNALKAFLYICFFTMLGIFNICPT